MNHSSRIKFINCNKKSLEEIGFDKTYLTKGLEKHELKTIKIHNLTPAQANILKQTAIASGTDCAVHREVITGKVEFSDCILSATLNQFRKIIEKLRQQPLKLSELAKELEKLLFCNEVSFLIRNQEFNNQNSGYIMGILNFTPDSFSDGGSFNNLNSAIEHYKKLVHDGADIIDIGGESTRPGAEKITVEEELNRVVPLIKEIRKFDKNTVISVDTRNSETAKRAVEEGADIINDISAGDFDPAIFDVANKYGTPIILNHSSASPDVMQANTDYGDIVDDLYSYFEKKIEELIDLGIEKSKIIIDPGIGFGKTVEQNFELIKRIEELKSLGCLILVGHSRKTFIQKTLDTKDNTELDKGTLIISQKLLDKSVNIIRVHNVKDHAELVKINSLLV